MSRFALRKRRVQQSPLVRSARNTSSPAELQKPDVEANQCMHSALGLREIQPRRRHLARLPTVNVRHRLRVFSIPARKIRHPVIDEPLFYGPLSAPIISPAAQHARTSVHPGNRAHPTVGKPSFGEPRAWLSPPHERTGCQGFPQRRCPYGSATGSGRTGRRWPRAFARRRRATRDS